MPTAADGFLRDIIEKPDDDAVRLIYADWLQDNGDPDRAEFIRLQIERASRGGEEPEKREAALLKKHEATWEKEVPAWARRHANFRVFRRGFIDHVVCTAREFLNGPAGMFRKSPVRSIEFRTYSERAAELAKCPELGRLRIITMDGWHADHLGVKGAKKFFASPHLSNVRELWLAVSRIGESGIKALADCAPLSGLTRLELNGNDLLSAGAAALASSPHLTSLRYLNLGRNQIGDKGASALADSTSLRGLLELEMWGNTITAKGVRALVQAPWRLTGLSLAANEIGDELASILASAPALASLRELVLGETGLTAAGVRTLAGSPHLAGLANLNLSDNKIGDEGAIALAESPHLGNLVHLHLRDAGVRDDGARALAKSKGLQRLKFLDVFESFTDFDPAIIAQLEKRLGSDGVITPAARKR
jgi:uncharacterized protein (TIGR02996 family)